MIKSYICQAAERAADAHAERTGDEGVKAAIVEALNPKPTISETAASDVERQLQARSSRPCYMQDVRFEATQCCQIEQQLQVRSSRPFDMQDAKSEATEFCRGILNRLSCLQRSFLRVKIIDLQCCLGNKLQ